MCNGKYSNGITRVWPPSQDARKVNCIYPHWNEHIAAAGDGWREGHRRLFEVFKKRSAWTSGDSKVRLRGGKQGRIFQRWWMVFFVDHIKSFYGRWYVWSILNMGNGMYTVLFFCSATASTWHQQTLNQQTIPMVVCLPVHMACLPTMFLLLVTCFTPYTKCSLLSIKHFRLSMVGPYQL